MIPFQPWILAASMSAPVLVIQEPHEIVQMRVTSADLRIAVVDRGTADGLAKQDRVRFRPRDGATFEGTIVRIGERVAVVELDDATFVPTPGTRAEVRIPRARLAAPAAPVAQAPGTVPVALDPPVWKNPDDEWTPEQPLLSRMQPLHPAEREPRVSGRAYAFADAIKGSEGGRSDIFARLGTDLWFENAFRSGGDLHVDGEFNVRDTDVPDDDDESKTRARLDRLSYSLGGDRFTPKRLEFGRFLHHGMPEFGVLDGVEWSQRLTSGSSFGGSTGFLPEADAEQETGDDLEISGFYRWVPDESELLSIACGYQKTFHDLAADRDLFVARVQYAPPEGWSFGGTAWVDWYTSGDTAKGSGPEITQAYVSTGRHFEGGSDVRLTYSHLAFPLNMQNDFLPVTEEQLANDHNDRAALHARQVLGRSLALVGHGGAWIDEDENGGDAEAGLELDDVFRGSSRVGASLFGSVGSYSTSFGWRAFLASTHASGDLRLGYEFAQNTIDGFADDNNELPEHRLRAAWSSFGDTGWSFSIYGDLQLYDSENAISAGVFLQRSF